MKYGSISTTNSSGALVTSWLGLNGAEKALLEREGDKHALLCRMANNVILWTSTSEMT